MKRATSARPRAANRAARERFTPLAAILISGFLVFTAACSRRPAATALHPTAFGSAIVEVSGGKQVAPVGVELDQPLVVQVNDAQGNAVTGAPVYMAGEASSFEPASGLTDSSGQFTSAVALGAIAGHYTVTAWTTDKAGKRIELQLQETALGYQQVLGRALNDKYCARCHDQESTAERVSNFDNLDPKPHAFTDGEALNKLSDADLAAVIGHGGPALNRSPQMPGYGNTLAKSDIAALVAYIRAIADPPYQAPGVTYAQR